MKPTPDDIFICPAWIKPLDDRRALLDLKMGTLSAAIGKHIGYWGEIRKMVRPPRNWDKVKPKVLNVLAKYERIAKR